MSTDRPGDPWAGKTYKGFAGPGLRAEPAAPPQQRPPPRRRSGGIPILAALGATGALALGVGLGLWVLRDPVSPPWGATGSASRAGAGDAAGGAAPQQAAPPEPPAIQPEPLPELAEVPATVSPPAQPLPAAPAPARPEPPQQQKAAPTQATARARPQPRKPPAGAPGGYQPQEGTLQAQYDALRAAEEPEGPPAAAAPPRGPRASFDCAAARPGAERMVCSDPAIAAEDREMARAYGRALQSGVDPRDLRQDQQVWTAIRDDAARRSRRALAQAYDQRIRDLDQMAAAGPDDSDDEP